VTAGSGGTPGRAAGRDPIDQLVSSTRRRLALFTLALVTALLLAVGVVTALVATNLMHRSIAFALQDAIAAAVASAGELEDDQRRLVAGQSDTVVLLLDEGGELLEGAGVAGLPGLPDAEAVAAAASTGRDDRDVTLGGAHLRLLTVPVTLPGHDGDPATAGFAQAVHRMEIHEQQEQQLLVAITIVSALGIAGAAVVTLLVTRRALGPIRVAFATERRFVASASHELRTPVAIVRASAEILERESLVGEGGAPLVADIIAEADRMGLLVTDLLALASAEAGALPVERRPMDLVAWLSGVARRAETMAGVAGLALVTDLPAERQVMVEADEDRLSQLLLILVDNAIEHSPPGRGVSLGLAAGGGYATIAVIDHGPGVAAADRERIFEPFARLPGRRRTSSGSGLGLAIAQQIARRHGAQLTAGDAPGGGARFSLRLPLVPAGAALA